MITQKAEHFAIMAHANDRYGDQPYEVHLRAVVATLIKFGYENPVLIAAAWLHDTLEDTATTAKALKDNFGLRVAGLVALVSDDPEMGSRPERKDEVCRRLAAAGDTEAIVLKLADRIANVENSLLHSPKHFSMYAKEHPHFKSRLYQPDQAEAMWTHLDKLIALGKMVSEPTLVVNLTQEAALLLRAKSDRETVCSIARPRTALHKDWMTQTDAPHMEPDEWLGICWNRLHSATKAITGETYLLSVADEVSLADLKIA